MSGKSLLARINKLEAILADKIAARNRVDAVGWLFVETVNVKQGDPRYEKYCEKRNLDEDRRPLYDCMKEHEDSAAEYA